MFHHDVQWPNIIQSADEPNIWLLIDWEDASECPTKCKPCFSLSDHSPRIREDNHGAKVDIWAIGHLITTSKVADLSEDFKNFRESIREQLNILTAQLVLEFMCKGSQSRYFVPKKSLYYAETIGSRNWTLHLYCFH